MYGIYIQAYPSLSYDSVNAYTLTVACTDSKDTVTGLFHVYITRNNAPVFTNLQGNLPPYNGSNVTYLTTTLVGRSRYCPISTILGILFEFVKTLMFIQNIKNKIVCILVLKFDFKWIILCRVYFSICSLDNCLSFFEGAKAINKHMYTYTNILTPFFLSAASVNVTSKTPTSTSIYTVTSSDAEGDQLYYNMTCSTTPCPFAIYHCM